MEDNLPNKPTAATMTFSCWFSQLPFNITLKLLKTEGLVITQKQLFIYWNRLDLYWEIDCRDNYMAVIERVNPIIYN